MKNQIELMVNLNIKMLFIICVFINTIHTHAQFETHENKYNIYAVNIPSTLSFANEPSPIYQLDIKHGNVNLVVKTLKKDNILIYCHKL